MMQNDLGFFAFCDPDYMLKLGRALRGPLLRRYVKTNIRGREIIWDRETAEVWSRPAAETWRRPSAPANVEEVSEAPKPKRTPGPPPLVMKR